MKKVAIIIDGDLKNRKGQVNASLNRIKYLKTIANYQIDVFAIQSYDDVLVRKLRKTEKRNRISSMNVDGIEIKLLWSKFSLINYLSVYKLKYKALFRGAWYRKYARLFQSYDLISAHSITCGRLALAIHEWYGVPFFVTWHGSDIHTLPYNNKYTRHDTVKVLENATYNFFVSKALLDSSIALTSNTQRELLYNGVGNEFFEYAPEKRKELRHNWNIEEKKVVAFIGNLFPIKNVLLLPDIFRQVADNYKENVSFWVIGDGKLRSSLEHMLQLYNVECKLWGNQPSETIPDFMNAIDVLVLPSKNEGLPLVTVEALACGANVVGSNVGGIAEVIGRENVFDLNDSFVENISKRIVKMLDSEIAQTLSEDFDWNVTAKKENEIYLRYLDK